MKISVEQRILSADDQTAVENQARFDAAGVFVLNFMASPGAGKTSPILATASHSLRQCGWGSSKGTWPR